MAIRNRENEFLMKNIIRGIIAPTLILCGMEISAAERRYTEVELLDTKLCGQTVTGENGCMSAAGVSSGFARTDGASSGTNRELPPRALQLEEPITSGTPFRWEDADKVQNGMTEAEVVAILGKPYSRRESGDDAILVWSYTSAGGSHAVACRFSKGRVISSHRVSR
jgi:guanyl-specific ribonuclease Sa